MAIPDTLSSATHLYLPLLLNVRGENERVRRVVLGVVILLVSGRMLLPPSTLLHVTVGCIDGSIGKVTLHSRAKFWPVIAEPIESTDTTGEGKPEGVIEKYQKIVNKADLSYL